MNFNRVLLKSKAKKLLFKNYGWILLVTIIFTLTSSVLPIPFFDNSVGQMLRPNLRINQSESVVDSNENPNALIQYDPNEIIKETKQTIEDAFKNMFPFYKGPIWTLIWTVMLVATFSSLLLKVFVFNPIQVGCIKWYLKNREEEKPKVRVVLDIFSGGYLKTVGIMFMRDLFTFLWTLLLIVPGIIKYYEYRMIPYLLAENPNMSRQEAFDMTRKIMDGNKMDTFVLDLSFLPWIILSSVLFGFLEILFVAPYTILTRTELYVCLCQGKEKYESTN